MSQDIIADALNQIMNAKRVEKQEVEIKKYSKLLLNLFDIMKKEEHIDYSLEDGKLIVKIIKINECKAIKPRFYATVDEIEKYLRRYLPARNFGKLIISTSKGLMNQNEAVENNSGGALLAYFY